MVYFVIGGSASGKSEYAEKLAASISKGRQLYYIATMNAYGEESSERIKKHQKMREGKGFITIECPKYISDIELYDRTGVALLEDVSNLISNLIYEDESTYDEIISKLNGFAEKFQDVIFVANNISEDGCDYDSEIKAYIEMISKVNSYLCSISDSAYEIVVGLEVKIK